MALFKNKYRVETTRLKDWDYSNPGWYYVTICTKEHKIMFGYIESRKMFLNKIGQRLMNIGMKYRNILRMFNWMNIKLCRIIFMELLC